MRNVILSQNVNLPRELKLWRYYMLHGHFMTNSDSLFFGLLRNRGRKTAKLQSQFLIFPPTHIFTLQGLNKVKH